MSMKRIFEKLKGDKSKAESTTPKASQTQQESTQSASVSKQPVQAKSPKPVATPPSTNATKAKVVETESVRPAPKIFRVRPKLPAVLTEKFLSDNFSNLAHVLNDPDVKNDTEDGMKIINFIVGNERLFERWLGITERLGFFIRIYPEKKQQCVNNILNWPETWDGFLHSTQNLFDFTDLCTKQHNQILDFVFSDRKVYGRFFSRLVIREMFEKYPDYRDTMMEILATDVELYNNCIMSSKDFWELFEDGKNADYKERFFEHHISDDKAYCRLCAFNFDHLFKVLEEFKHRKPDIMKFILSTDDRFELTFGNLFKILYYCEKHPEDKELLFNRAKTTPNYIKGRFTDATDLLALKEADSEFADYVEGEILKDPEWLLKIGHMTDDFERVYKLDSLKRLKAEFLTQFYKHPDSFTFNVTYARDLDPMIAIAPDQESKLRLYCQIYTLKTPLADVIKAQYQNKEAMDELKVYVSRCMMEGSFAQDVIKASREVVAELINAEENATFTESLQDLKVCFDMTPAISQAAALGKNFPKVSVGTQEQGAKMLQPSLPDRTNSN